MSGYVILLLGGLQGLILSVIIVSKRSAQPANNYLAAFVFLLGLGSIIDNNLISIRTELFVIVWSGNSFLFAPLLYLYIKRLSLLVQNNFKNLYFHFLVFILMKSVVIILHFVPIVDNNWLATIGISLNLFLAVYNIAYGLYTLKFLSKNKRIFGKDQYKWVQGMAVIFLSYSILLVLRRISSEFVFPSISSFDNYLYLVAAVVLYWMSYRMINEPNLLLNKKKYSHSKLNHSDIVAAGNRIESYLTSTKAFTDPRLNLDQVSKMLEIPKHHLSQIISEYFNQTFYEQINELRVRKAKVLLFSEDYKHLSITGIAMECGFQSKSVFNKSFKKLTGKTPSEYIKAEKTLR